MIRKRLFIAFISLLVSGVVVAQDLPSQGPPILQFSFSNPGARSLGFGGAFVALADDATAAFANPAGLIQITRPEVSIEGRSWGYSTPFTQRGRLEGEPSGIGVDVVAGLRNGTSSDDLSGLSFLSVVYPGKNWSIAFYRHQLADFEFLSQTQGLFGPGRFFERRVKTDLEVVNFGLAGAFRVSDALSVGLAAVYFEADLESVNEPFVPDADESLGVFAPTSYLPERRVASVAYRLHDTSWGLNAGLLWTVSPRWRLGGFYRQSPRFELQAVATAGPAGSFFGLPPAGTVFDDLTSPVALPGVYGLGWAFRTDDGSLTVAFEWDRIEYSTILDSLDQRELESDNIVFEDGDELHLGAEYVFSRSKLIAAARLGVWLDPDHRPSFTAESSALDRALSPPGADEVHYALGFGLAFESLQIDLGVDLSDLVDTVSVSAIYGF